jgi:pyrroline-5-carboxylate reductase
MWFSSGTPRSISLSLVTVLSPRILRAALSPSLTPTSSKPNIAKLILSEDGMDAAIDGKLVISICAGVTIAQLQSWVPESCVVVRAMPNTPCKIREGMTVVTPIADPLSRALILAIFTSCGRCRFLDEKYFDACTAVAGSGPAFVALVLEAMADGGVMMGLPRPEALELAAQSEWMSR